jgi:hypothetical protein
VNDILEYLKSVVEGVPGIKPWKEWFEKNDQILSESLTRSEYLHLKRERIKAIPVILDRFGIRYMASDVYEWLGGKPGYCRDCGSKIIIEGNYRRCPSGCFEVHLRTLN